MNTGKNRVKGLKTELFKKKYQTDPLVKNLTNELDMSGNQLVVKPTVEPNIQRPPSVYDESFYKIPEYNQVTEANRFSKSDELTKGMPKLEDLNTNITPPEPKTDWRDYVRTGVGAISAIKGVYDDVQTRQDNNERIQNLNDRPRYMPNEYEYMGRPGSQSTIYAKHGAEIRRGTQSGAEEAELERGEMFMMPNTDTYVVGGKKHSQGGEDFVLPEGTIVFSDHLKVPGIGKTFSTEAKKYDVTKYKKILDNPHAKAVDRTTAEVLFDRNIKKLQELFQIQQQMNGNSNGEMGEKVQAQKGMFFDPNNIENFDTPEITNPNNLLTAINNQVTQVESNSYKDPGKAGFIDPNISDTIETNQSFRNAAQNSPNDPATLGATPTPTLNTSTEQNKQVMPDENGTKSYTNAANSSSVYWKTLPNGKRIWQENQGDFAGKSYSFQYGNNASALLRNRFNENEKDLNPLFTDAFNLTIKNEKLKISNGNQLIDILEGGNSDLIAIRNFYKNTGKESELFDVQLDKGYNPDIQRQKAAEKYKAYIESSQFAQDVLDKKVSPDAFPFLKNKPVAYKDANGVTMYKIDNPELDLDAVEKYQAAYKAIASVKDVEKKKGKDKDRLKGFRVAPEGLADQMFLGMAISDEDKRLGNTSLGQVLGFEDDPIAPKPKPEDPLKKKDVGNNYNKQLKNATMGKYNPEGFDYPQLAPEIYGAAASQMYAYAPMDYNAPYLMPQTLNIQPQLQDIDNSYTAAMNAGGDPNSALIATLGAKQKIYSEKQNFDAQQRAAADQYNAQSRFQEDIYDMQSLDKVYNSLIAQADDAVTAQRQALVASASQKRAVWKQEEAKKQFWYNNFVTSFDYDPKTRSLVVKKDAPKELSDQIGSMFSTTAAIPELDKITITKK